jgi:hypothetical protein
MAKARGKERSGPEPDYWRASRQRLAAARLLAEHRLNLDAIYLGGYATECALKALLLARTSPRQRAEVFATISRGQRAHDLERLKVRLESAGCPMPPPVLAAFRHLAIWSPELRYLVGSRPEAAAREFLTAVQELHDWAQRSW